MDDRFAAFEADFPAILREVVNSALDAKLPSQLDSHISAYFEQFRHELTHDFFNRREGGGPSNPPSSDPHGPTALAPNLHPPNLGIPNPRPPWQQWLEFPRFMKGEDIIAWITRPSSYSPFMGFLMLSVF